MCKTDLDWFVYKGLKLNVLWPACFLISRWKGNCLTFERDYPQILSAKCFFRIFIKKIKRLQMEQRGSIAIFVLILYACPTVKSFDWHFVIIYLSLCKLRALFDTNFKKKSRKKRHSMLIPSKHHMLEAYTAMSILLFSASVRQHEQKYKVLSLESHGRIKRLFVFETYFPTH